VPPITWDRQGHAVELWLMKIAIGADHAGFELKQKVKQHLIDKGLQVDDMGTSSLDSVDYPDFARKVGEDVVQNRTDLGILVCGTGIGMAMAANKVPGIRAANVSTEFEAQMAREHNNANVLTLGARVLDEPTALKLVDKWLETQFAGGRHQLRVDKIMKIEQQEREQRA
jgi:ribose 5-phosphate isomerase B